MHYVGKRVKPSKMGSWINVSDLTGIDGGWCFKDTMEIKKVVNLIEEGNPGDTFISWCEKYEIEFCFYVARDMGVEPPRKIDVKFHLPDIYGINKADMALE